jgi:hypothetical protein
VLAEALDPDLVEDGPVVLQVAHDDPDPHDVAEPGAARGQDRGQVVEQLVRLGARVLGDPALLGMNPEQPAFPLGGTVPETYARWVRTRPDAT